MVVQTRKSNISKCSYKSGVEFEEKKCMKNLQQQNLPESCGETGHVKIPEQFLNMSQLSFGC